MDGDVRRNSAAETQNHEPGRTGPGPSVADALSSVPAHDVRSLTQGGSVALMVLDGVAYTLRITRAGKLILTK